MHWTRRTVIVLGSALAGACAPEPIAVTPDDLVGTWQGARWSDRTRILWSTTITAQGAITIRFLTCFNGEALTREEQTGTTTIEDSTWRIVVTSLDYSDLRSGDTEHSGGFAHDYTVTRLTNDELRYRSTENGNRFRVTRASPDAELTCPPPRIDVGSGSPTDRERDGWINRGVGDGEEKEDSATAN
ncbi:MAG: hypothetical protein AAF610_03755 [Pseudomonadota bacterium]